MAVQSGPRSPAPPARLRMNASVDRGIQVGCSGASLAVDALSVADTCPPHVALTDSRGTLRIATCPTSELPSS
jgi:hypothetical protein